ncbi:DinB family protein [Oxalobacteraceae bacterium]|nr:DinB family protein [Oxalobacteraceae bacterium]
MSTPAAFILLSEYNRAMNRQVYEAAACLAPAELLQERGAFFGSILGTLNHLVVADTIWLKRFCALDIPTPLLDPVRAMDLPSGLAAMLETELPALAARRGELDAIIERWIASLTADDLARQVRYANTKGVRFSRGLGMLLLHVFNHQTHHRGQASTLLFQAGQDIGVTDLLAGMPNEE